MTRCHSTVVTAIVLLLLGTASAFGQLWDREGTHVIFVAKKGGDFNSIQAAIDSITNATADYPYLVYVAPGVYEEQVHMKEYVDIEGAGEEITKITTTGQGHTLRGTFTSRLSSLTVECIGGDMEYCSTFFDVLPFEVSQVTIRANAGRSAGLLYCAGAFATFNDVVFEITRSDGSCDLVFDNDCACCGARAILDHVSTWVGPLSCASPIYGTHFTVRDSAIGDLAGTRLDLSQVEVFGGVSNYGRSPSVIRQSVIHGDIWSYHGDLISISHSQVDGEVVLGNENSKCFSVHDADLNPLDETCQPIP